MNILGLPVELQERILLNLSLIDIYRCKQVCLGMYRLIDTDAYWQQLVQRWIIQIPQNVLRYQANTNNKPHWKELAIKLAAAGLIYQIIGVAFSDILNKDFNNDEYIDRLRKDSRNYQYPFLNDNNSAVMIETRIVENYLSSVPSGYHRRVNQLLKISLLGANSWGWLYFSQLAYARYLMDKY